MAEKIIFEMESSLLQAVAVANGWSPMVDDTELTIEEIDGDEFPQIPNPLTYQVFLQGFIPQFIESFVREEGRKKVLGNLNSIADVAKDQVNKGAFDELILTGRSEQIKDVIKTLF